VDSKLDSNHGHVTVAGSAPLTGKCKAWRHCNGQWHSVLLLQASVSPFG